MNGSYLRLPRLSGDLPDMPAGVFEAGGTDAPGPVHWAVQQFHAARG